MSASSGAFEFVPEVHAAGETITVPYDVARALAWWVASELIRRHPKELGVLETHPLDGFYDCLSVFRHEGEQVALVAHLNLAGHITHASWFDQPEGEHDRRYNWLDVLASDDGRRQIIEPLERVEGLGIPNATPPTTKRSIGPRVLARFATATLLSSHNWHIRNGPEIANQLWNGMHPSSNGIPGTDLDDALPTDVQGNRSSRFWVVLDHKHRAFTAVDVERGLAWRRDGGGVAFDLLAIYKQHDGRVDAVMRKVMPDVE